jgi:glycerol-3-phosphate cytidylyltransferase
MEPQPPERTRPTHTFLPGSGSRDDWQHKLFIRQLDPHLVEPLDGREPEITFERGVRLLEGLKAESPLTWWIGVGTALGYAREGGFIRGDTDIDVRIALDFRDQAAAMTRVREVVERFEAAGFRVIREMHWDRRPMQTAFTDTRNRGVVFDIYYFYTSYTDGHYVNVNEIGYREKPAHFIDDLERDHWPAHPDIPVYLPSPLDDYNEWRWGPEWWTPKRKDELSRDLDERCIRDLPTQHVVLTYGTFDLFHNGHARLLEHAAAIGDRLVVGVVSDPVLHQKGKSCITTQEQRAETVASVRWVDEVFVQERLDQKESDIERFDASYLVVGEDWRDHPRFERARGWRGVEIEYLPRTPGVSSTTLRNRTRNAVAEEAYGSLAALRGALDPDEQVRIETLGSGSTAAFVAAAMAQPTPGWSCSTETQPATSVTESRSSARLGARSWSISMSCRPTSVSRPAMPTVASTASDSG